MSRINKIIFSVIHREKKGENTRPGPPGSHKRETAIRIEVSPSRVARVRTPYRDRKTSSLSLVRYCSSTRAASSENRAGTRPPRTLQ